MKGRSLMKIYQITAFGRRIARSVRAPDGVAWKTLFYLDRAGGQATDTQIAEGAGLTESDVRSAASILKRKQMIEEV
jgi:hypothetical protein